MATFIDTFVEASSDTLLQNHTPTGGGDAFAWDQISGGINAVAATDDTIGTGAAANVYRIDTDLGSNQYAQAEYVTTNADGRVYVKMAAAANSGYYARSNGTLVIIRVTAGSEATLASKSLTVSAGSVLKITYEDGTVKAYVDDVEELSASDSNHAALLRPGLGQWATSGRMDNYEAGDIVAAGSSTSPNSLRLNAGRLGNRGVNIITR